MNRLARSDYPNYVGSDRVFLTAEWQYLAMLNYEVDTSLLLPFVPAGTELDRWEGKVFASLVGFRFLKTKLLGFLPIPMHSNFEEVNMRFYVRRQAGTEVRRGVCSSGSWFRAGQLHSLPARSTRRIMRLSQWRMRFALLAIIV